MFCDPLFLHCVFKGKQAPCSAGHASTRIGWAIVEDAKVAQAMRNWIWMNGIVAIEGQAKAAGLLEFVTSTQGVQLNLYMEHDHRSDHSAFS